MKVCTVTPKMFPLYMQELLGIGLAGKIFECYNKSHEAHPLVGGACSLRNVGFQCFLRAH